jgi:uncharacterized membrane protein
MLFPIIAGATVLALALALRPLMRRVQIQYPKWRQFYLWGVIVTFAIMCYLVINGTAGDKSGYRALVGGISAVLFLFVGVRTYRRQTD